MWVGTTPYNKKLSLTQVKVTSSQVLQQPQVSGIRTVLLALQHCLIMQLNGEVPHKPDLIGTGAFRQLAVRVCLEAQALLGEVWEGTGTGGLCQMRGVHQLQLGDEHQVALCRAATASAFQSIAHLVPLKSCLLVLIQPCTYVGVRALNVAEGAPQFCRGGYQLLIRGHAVLRNARRSARWCHQRSATFPEHDFVVTCKAPLS